MIQDETLSNKDVKSDKKLGIPNSLEGIQFKSFAIQVETYNKKYVELKENIKEARKSGKDVYIADLHIMSFKAKIHIAEITRQQKDLDIVRNMLITTEKELNEAIEEKIINVKEEVETGAKKLIEVEDTKKFKDIVSP